MDAKKLARIKGRIKECRKRPNNIRHRELASIAQSLGRERSKVRINEPTFISTILGGVRPISIPDHPGALKRRTAESILDDLEADVIRFEEMLEIEKKRG